MDLCQVLMLSRAAHETEVRKMDKQPGRSMKDKSYCEEHFQSSSHEIQLDMEWGPSLLARRQDESIFRRLSNNWTFGIFY